MKPRRAHTLVLGLGNPILSDDAVGPRVAEAVRRYLAGRPGVEVKEASVGGLKLLDEILGYWKVVLVDSIETEGGKPGHVYTMTPENLRGTAHLVSPHEVNFMGVLEMARKQEMEVPEHIVVVAVEIKDNTTFGEKMSPEVEAAIPQAVGEVLKEVGTVG
jgi:hydrogenase maturation protease